VVFMGTPDFSVPVLETIIKEGYEVVGVVTQPDRPVGRKRILTPTPVKQKALEHNIPVFQPEKIKDDYQTVLDWNPDLIITAAFGQIIPKVLLDAPKFGCINVHASLLPKYRGGAPIHKAIIDGEKETGVTIMYMDVKMDTGDMISKVVVPIEENDHTGSMFEKLSVAGAELLAETLPKLLAGEIEAVPQNHEEATFAWNIKREDERIDWYKPANVLYNQVRGLHPWPVAFTQLDDLSVKIWWAEPNNHLYDAEPGTIVKVEKDGIVVTCGDHAGLKITDIQISGKKRMDVVSLLNGSHPIEVGKKFN
ncbi:MAG: methionyl-tRNA formyltransferase, partial [Turicibacter sp.]|nr:methionyl-tRNA formyltransferase [Turicibacter sp.]